MPRGSTPYARRTQGASTQTISVTIDSDVLAQVRLLLQDQFTGKTAYAGFSTLVDSLLRTWLKHQQATNPTAAAKLASIRQQKEDV